MTAGRNLSARNSSKHRGRETTLNNDVIQSCAVNNCRARVFGVIARAQHTLTLNHGLIRYAKEACGGAGFQMAQPRTDVRADVRRYLVASAAGFFLGVTLGFLMMFSLG